MKFEGQQGLDWGGITKMFINKLSDCIFDTDLPDTIWVGAAPPSPSLSPSRATTICTLCPPPLRACRDP